MTRSPSTNYSSAARFSIPSGAFPRAHSLPRRSVSVWSRSPSRRRRRGLRVSIDIRVPGASQLILQNARCREAAWVLTTESGASRYYDSEHQLPSRPASVETVMRDPRQGVSRSRLPRLRGLRDHRDNSRRPSGRQDQCSPS